MIIIKRVINDFNSNEIILNAFYQQFDDNLLIVTKNIHTGQKFMKEYPAPKVPIYVTLPDFKSTKYREQITRDQAEEHWVSYRWREFDIARILQIPDFVDRIKSKELQPKQVHLDKRLFSSDIHIEDLVMREYFKFCLTYDDKGEMAINFPIIDKFHISGLDIETDINISDNPEEQPVIMNTAIDNKSWKVKTACLINSEYKGQKEIMEDPESFKKEFKQALYDHIENIDMDEDNVDKKLEKEKKMKKLVHELADQLEIDLIFTDKEEDVMRIPTEFLFKETHPDFCYIYNAQYDIGHMQGRSKAIGFDFDSMFQYKDSKIYNSFVFNSTDPDPKFREHYYNAHNPTKIIDQLLQYAQLRRGKLFPKYSLDATAKREVGVSKLDYSKICSYIGDFPYVDYKHFLMYNIIDVFVMLILDKVTNDTYSQVYSRFNLCTEWGRLAKPMRRTTNVFDTLATIQGYLPGNELNGLFLHMEKKKIKKIQEKDPNLYNTIQQLLLANTKDKKDNPYRIKGGCVTDPNLIKPEIITNSIYKVPIKGYKKLENCADLDATSMYPSNTEANNGSKSTLVGILNKLNNKEGDNISQLAALSMINENFNSIGHYFFNLPLAEELIQEYYGVFPQYKSRVAELKGFNKEKEFEHKDNKDFKKYRDIVNKLFKPKYDIKDKDAGAPSLSKYIFTADTNKIVLSYYNMLIEMELLSDRTFNQMNDLEGKGFVCGNMVAKEKKIINYNDEYISYMIPEKKYPDLSECKFKGLLSEEERTELENARVRPYNLKLGNYKITLTSRSIFWCNMSKDVEVEVYDLIKDEHLSLAKFTTTYEINKKESLKVTQHIVFFRV